MIAFEVQESVTSNRIKKESEFPGPNCQSQRLITMDAENDRAGAFIPIEQSQELNKTTCMGLLTVQGN